MARFDEIELQPAIFEFTEEPDEPVETPAFVSASRLRRLLALLTDLSLFVALSFALWPLLPASMPWTAVAALAAFVVVLSFYYFVGCWLLWGKTIGGTIFDVRILPVGSMAMPFQSAMQRWLGVWLSLLTGGIGFALAALPSRRSLPDRLSSTMCVR
jgi:hypothetical protein